MEATNDKDIWSQRTISPIAMKTKERKNGTNHNTKDNKVPKIISIAAGTTMKLDKRKQPENCPKWYNTNGNVPSCAAIGNKTKVANTFCKTVWGLKPQFFNH